MNHRTFTDREDAGWMLVERLRGQALHDPLVLAIPRGGVETGAAIARGLGCELDVVLARKLRAPHQPELAIGAVSEDGDVYLNDFAAALTDVGSAFIEAERRRQLAEIARRHAPVGRYRLVAGRDGTNDTMEFRAEVALGDRSDDLAAAIGETIQAVTKLRARVAFVDAGNLPNDGKVIEDTRSHG
jgi:predicted phosphoribosyltransferase